jgi:tetratricopeptide (TPR) repeat protein
MSLFTFVGACAVAAASLSGVAGRAGQAYSPPAGQAPSARIERPAPPQPPPGMTQAAEAYYQFLLGRHLESDGDVEGAVRAYIEAGRLDPRSADIKAELASLDVRENRLEDALKNAEAALTLDSKNVTAHRVLGVLHASLAAADEGSGPLGADAKAAAAKAVEHLDAARRYADVTDTALDLMLAQIYYRTGEYAKAIEVLTHIVDDEPGRPEPITLLLQAYDRAGRADDAVKLLEAIAPEQPQYYATLAELYSRRQRWSDAAQAYERAAARNPRNAELRMRLATALLSDGSDALAARAIDVLQQLRKESPADTRVLYFLSEAQRRAGRPEDAEQTARTLMQADPAALTGPYALALALEARQQHRQVVDALAPLLARPASSAAGIEAAPLFVHLGFAYHELGEFDAALTAFEGARKAAPSNQAVDVYILQTQVSARRFDAAIALARKLRAAVPGDQRVVRLEAEALRRTGRAEEGDALLTGALNDDPGDLAAYLALAEHRSQAGQFEAAMQVLDRAAATFPSNLSVPFEAGAVLERHKRFADAERKFREVLAKDPLNAPTLNYLGYMLADRGERLDEAIGYIQRALAVEPHNAAYLDSLGWAYYRQDKVEQAEPWLRRAAEQHVRGSAVQDHLGDVLFKLGRYGEAVAAWQRALAGDGEQIDRPAIDRKIRSAREKAPKK